MLTTNALSKRLAQTLKWQPPPAPAEQQSELQKPFWVTVPVMILLTDVRNMSLN